MIGDAFKMITRLQRENDGGVRRRYIEELTMPTTSALERGFV